MNSAARNAGLTAVTPNPVAAATEQPVRNSTMRATYTGAELSNSNNRLGSRDALRLPSRTFYGTRVPESSEA